MKNKILAAILVIGIWVPMILVTIEELTNHAVSFGITETALIVAALCIFGAIPLAAIQLIRK